METVSFPKLSKSQPSRYANLATLQTVEVIQAMKPEWLRLPASIRVSGLSRSHLFDGIKKGALKHVHVKRPGATKGVLLINYDSLMAYIESFGVV